MRDVVGLITWDWVLILLGKSFCVLHATAGKSFEVRTVLLVKTPIKSPVDLSNIHPSIFRVLTSVNDSRWRDGRWVLLNWHQQKSLRDYEAYSRPRLVRVDGL